MHKVRFTPPRLEDEWEKSESGGANSEGRGEGRGGRQGGRGWEGKGAGGAGVREWEKILKDDTGLRQCPVSASV